MSGKLTAQMESDDAVEHRIPVVIVESHNHVLEHIHTVLRHRQRRSSTTSAESWRMVHFDSHADLACPSTATVMQCFRPNDEYEVEIVEEEVTASSSDSAGANRQQMMTFYETLDSVSSGIAEWILPLVMSANLKHIHWIRRQQQTYNFKSIPIGKHAFHVGAHIAAENDDDDDDDTPINHFYDVPLSSKLKVDWCIPYYMEDNTYVTTNELYLKQNVCLHVTESNESTTPQRRDDEEEDMPWLLDICLDYFLCKNPYLTDLIQVNKSFTYALLEVLYHSKLYNHSTDTTTTTTTTTLFNPKLIHKFRSGLQAFLQSFASNQRQPTSNNNNYVDFNIATTSICDTAVLVSEWKQEFYTTTPNTLESCDGDAGAVVVLSQLEKTFTAIDGIEVQKKIIAMAIEAIPNLTMPHEEEEMEHDDDHTTDSSYETVAPTGAPKMTALLHSLLETVRSYIKNKICQQSCDNVHDTNNNDTVTESKKHVYPFMITIARSGDDGFTPHGYVDLLQQQILHILHTSYCCFRCKCNTNTIEKTEASVSTNTALNAEELPNHSTCSCCSKENATGHTHQQQQSCCKLNILYDYDEWEGSTLSL